MATRLWRSTAAGVAVMLALTACASRTTSNEPSASASGSISTLQEEAMKKVAEFTSQRATYPGPTEAFKPGSFKVGVAGCGFAVPGCKTYSEEGAAALAVMGYKVEPAFDTAFSPQKAGTFMDRAVQQGLDGVLLYSLDVDTFPEATQRALDAGLAVVCVVCATSKRWAGRVHDVTADWKAEGAMAAWAMIAEHGENVKAVTFHDNVYRSTVLRAEGLVETLKAHCESCSIDDLAFQSADISKPGPPQINALLSSKPKGQLTNIAGHYDEFAAIASRTITQSGRSEISVSGYDGKPSVVPSIITGKPAPIAFTIGTPLAYSVWAGADVLGRVLNHLPLWKGADSLPSTLIDKSNANHYLDDVPGPKGDWRASFKALWTSVN